MLAVILSINNAYTIMIINQGLSRSRVSFTNCTKGDTLFVKLSTVYGRVEKTNCMVQYIVQFFSNKRELTISLTTRNQMLSASPPSILMMAELFMVSDWPMQCHTCVDNTYSVSLLPDNKDGATSFKKNAVVSWEPSEIAHTGLNVWIWVCTNRIEC